MCPFSLVVSHWSVSEWPFGVPESVVLHSLGLYWPHGAGPFERHIGISSGALLPSPGGRGACTSAADKCKVEPACYFLKPQLHLLNCPVNIFPVISRHTDMVVNAPLHRHLLHCLLTNPVLNVERDLRPAAGVGCTVLPVSEAC